MSIMVLENRGLGAADPLIGSTLSREQFDVRSWRSGTATHMNLDGLGTLPQAISDRLRPFLIQSAALMPPQQPSVMGSIMANPIPVVVAAIGGIAVGLVVVKLARKKKAG